MIETTPHGIQMSLFDYFQDVESFSIQDANRLVLEHQQRDVNKESIRARIYEGIDKGLFERVGKGLYTVTRKDKQGRENTCLLINGDGRDLSFLPDNSVDAIITDHPYDLSKSLVGRNRNFANYELFQYNEEDFRQKLRVLKPGCFLVEFLPEENADNYEYLYQVKDMARKAGFEYFARVPWKKGDFIANTGRKSKNTEDILFFSKGKARDLRRDVQRDKQYEASHTVVEFEDYIPGSTTVHYSDMGGLGSSTESSVEPVDVKLRLSVMKGDADRARALLDEAWENAVIYSFEDSPLDVDNGGLFTLEQLYDMPVQEYMLKYISASGLIFDDLSKGPVEHYMSGTAGMLPTVFDVSPVKNKIHQAEKPVELMEQILRFVTKEDELVLDQFAGSGVAGEAALNTHRNSILIEKDPDAYGRMQDRLSALGKAKSYGEKGAEALHIAIKAIGAQAAGGAAWADFVEYQNKSGMPLKEAAHQLWMLPEKQPEEVVGALDFAKDIVKNDQYKRVLECSPRGDKRFSPEFASVIIRGQERSIAEWYQDSKRTADGKRVGADEPFDHIIDPFTGDKLSRKDAVDLYRGLWITYLSTHPELVQYAKQFDVFSNIFTGKKGIENGYHIIVEAYVKGDRERYVAVVKCSHWYKNMVRHKNTLSEKIAEAEKIAGGPQKNIGVSEHSKPVVREEVL